MVRRRSEGTLSGARQCAPPERPNRGLDPPVRPALCGGHAHRGGGPRSGGLGGQGRAQAAWAEAGDDGDVFICSSTQHPSEIQTIVAEVVPDGLGQDVPCLAIDLADGRVVSLDRLDIAGELSLGGLGRLLRLQHHLSDRYLEPFAEDRIAEDHGPGGSRDRRSGGAMRAQVRGDLMAQGRRQTRLLEKAGDLGR